jgi:D-glycero-alpha-D-manno-heptose 1-phosphate guanylyltransferase
MECIILAGGLGTRLRSVINEFPKCLAPVAGKPFLYYIFNYLVLQNVTHIILSVGYKYEMIQKWIQQYVWPFTISYAIEIEPLGTGGAIKLAMQQIKEDQFFIMNGDTYFNVDLQKFSNEHKEHHADLSIALKPMSNFDRYGNIMVDANHRIISFVEKQYCIQGQINGGTYLLNTSSKLMNNPSNKFSFESEVLQIHFPEYNFHGFIDNAYFIDIGIPEDFEKANHEFKNLFV